MGGRRKTHAEFESQVMERGEGDYQLLSEYENNKTRIKMKHIVCGNEYMVRPTKFLQGNRCPACSVRKSKTTEEFFKNVEILGEGDYQVLTPYKTHKEKVIMKHVSCGREYEVRPTNFMQGSRCLHCYGTQKKTHEDFLLQVLDEGKREYQLLSTYKNARTNVQLRHEVCGHEYNVRPDKFLAGVRCPNCSSSKGEHFVAKLLEKIGLLFESEVSFPECKNVKPLRFDFGVKDEKGNLVFLIEYDGVQHFKENSYFGGRTGYIRRLKNDRIKSNFAKEKGIPLLRIRYDQKSPEKLLLKVIENLNIIRNFQEKQAS